MAKSPVDSGPNQGSREELSVGEKAKPSKSSSSKSNSSSDRNHRDKKDKKDKKHKRKRGSGSGESSSKRKKGENTEEDRDTRAPATTPSTTTNRVSESDDTPPPATNATHPKNAAARAWNQQFKDAQELEKNTKIQIGIYVKKTLFPKCKFLDESMFQFVNKPRHLSYEVCQRFDLEDEEEFRRKWWVKYSPCIKEEFRARRNYCCTSMKKEFGGKFFTV